MTTPNTSLDLLTWTEICERYPDAWVMVGLPENETAFSEEKRRGYVLFADSDELAFAQYAVANMQDLEKNPQYKKFFNRYTGNLPTTQGKKVTSFLKKVA